jgi:hypothetical protein
VFEAVVYVWLWRKVIPLEPELLGRFIQLPCAVPRSSAPAPPLKWMEFVLPLPPLAPVPVLATADWPPLAMTGVVVVATDPNVVVPPLVALLTPTE